MRTIKFRGERTFNREWVYGYYIYDKIADEHLIWEDGSWIQVIPETVGQFTGLYDNNSKEIFEGDILKRDNPNYGYGDPRQPEYLFSPLRDLEYLYGDDNWIFICQSGEIIGNIHDNPELIPNTNVDTKK